LRSINAGDERRRQAAGEPREIAMTRSVRRITVCLDGSPQGDALVRQAAGLARRLSAGLIGVRSLERPCPSPPETFARGTGAIHEVLEHQAAEEQTLARAAGEAFAALVRPFGVETEFRPVWRDDPQATAKAADGDLVVLGRPRLPGLPDALTADRLLLNASRPVLLIPDDWTEDLGRRVLIGWNGSPAARQAVDQAVALMAPDAAVTILVVDEAAAPGTAADLAGTLGAAGVRAEVRQAVSRGDGVAEAIVAAANAVAADLVVLGGYSRSPTVERWFGGVTRSLLASARHPLLLSHVPKATREAVDDDGAAAGRGARDG
jgi:nucleotide-binding universal stress UspA family protein